jgi:Cu+-exporting ATPase
MREGEMKVTDPVCKMSIEEKDAVATSVYKGTTYHFCSKPCKDEFDENPEAFAREAGPPPGSPSRGRGAIHTCPMHPEVRQAGPGPCPKCGMALEPLTPQSTVTEWTCPMHPEIVRDAPGSCPLCGMALEPKTVSAEGEENPELVDMTRRFRVCVVLSVPLVIVAMREIFPGNIIEGVVSPGVLKWVELLLATPVVLWGGKTFFARGWKSITNRSPNMFTLIGLGTGVAYAYSIVATLFPRIFPQSFRSETGEVGTYFEAAAVIVTLVLMGQVLELRARSRTGAAIKALLGRDGRGYTP